jgi:hypothetical protein
MDTYKAKQLLLKLIDDNLIGTPDDSDLLEAKFVVENMADVTKDDILYMLITADAEGCAGRHLTAQELYSAKNGVESGMGYCWTDIMTTAVEEAMQDKDIDHGDQSDDKRHRNAAKKAGQPYERIIGERRYTFVEVRKTDACDGLDERFGDREFEIFSDYKKKGTFYLYVENHDEDLVVE